MSEHTSPKPEPGKHYGVGPDQKEKAPQLPALVTVEGWRGSLWRHGSTAEVLSTRVMEDRRNAALDRTADRAYTHLAARMDDGDILVVLVENPEEADPEKREYALTSVAMNQGRHGESIRGIPLPPSELEGICFTPGEHVILGDKESKGSVEEVVSWNSKREALQNPDGSWRYPESTIWRDFQRGVGLV